MYSLKSSSGASKSGAMYSTVPLSVPGRRGFRRVSGVAINLATGLPSAVMTISSPGASLPINSLRLAWASSHRD